MGKKSGMIIGIMLAGALGLTACGQLEEANELVKEESTIFEEVQSELLSEESKETTVENKDAAESKDTTEGTTQEITEEELQKVFIYYGNGTVGGLKMEEVSMSEISAATLLGLLGRHNIVSIDTKAQNFEEKEENGKKTIYLDLSKQFKDYVKMMGKDGEYIVIAGLTDTFLSAYQADELVLTVAGTTLVTNYNKYDVPMEFYALSAPEQQDTSYELTEVIVEEENIHIAYPQFTNMKNEKVMTQWNASIKDAAMQDYQESTITEYTMTYEITTQNAGMVSMILRGHCNYEGAAYPTTIKSTFNFDLTTGKNKRLKDYGNLEELADALQNGYGYKMLQEGITREDLTTYLSEGFIEDYQTLLQSYDYDLSNKNLIPTGFSYIKNGEKLVLVVEVNHALGDYQEIEIE